MPYSAYVKEAIAKPRVASNSRDASYSRDVSNSTYVSNGENTNSSKDTWKHGRRKLQGNQKE
jgi:hypothetical protein